MKDQQATSGRPLIVVGESLIDRFPDGSEVIGGAPLNVAWHLGGWGLSPCFITAVGDDATGMNIRKRLRQWGINTDWVQLVSGKPTGTVLVHDPAGEPRYEFVADTAMDHLEMPTAAFNSDLQHNAGGDAGAILYHGTLAIRNLKSRTTVMRMRQESMDDVFVDLNLRFGQYDQRVLGDVISGVHYLKCNTEELETLAAQKLTDPDDIPKLTGELFRLCDQLRCCWVTDGAAGAYQIDKYGKVLFEPAPTLNAAELRDSVGAGDAFSAMVLRGLSFGWEAEMILGQAVQFAAQVCLLRGATPLDRTFYAA